MQAKATKTAMGPNLRPCQSFLPGVGAQAVECPGWVPIWAHLQASGGQLEAPVITWALNPESAPVCKG